MRRLILGIVTVLFISLSMNPFSTQAAIADGTYSINYQVNKPGSSSASMANDYFAKPAKLIVNNGKMTMQLTIKNSSWVTEFNPPGGATVLSSNPTTDQRVVQFSVASASLVTIAMTIDIADIDYHHSYSVDYVFNSSDLPEAQVEATKPEPTKPEAAKPTTSKPAQATQSTGSNTSLNKPATSENVDNNSSDAQSDSGQVDEQAEESVSDDEQAEGNEVVENPETSDELPLIALIVFILAMIVLSRTKQTKTN